MRSRALRRSHHEPAQSADLLDSRRRACLRLAIAASGSIMTHGLLAGSSAVAALPAVPVSKPIPQSGERLPVIGLGGRDFRLAHSIELEMVISRLIDLGGSVIDTAAAYGGGESEQVIGQALAEVGARPWVFLATKLTGAPQSGFGRSGALFGRQSFERSLELLKTDHLDLLQVHNLVGVEAAWPLLLELKQSGKVRYLGITTSDPQDHEQLAQLMQRYPLDFIEVDYSIANRDAAHTLLPLARERKVAVLIDVPLGGAGRGGFSLGMLMGKPLPPFAADWEVRDWPQLLLKYVVSHPAVTCAIPGTIRLDHLEDDQAAAHGRLPNETQRRELESYWDRVIAPMGSTR
jgi:aryl-alcohol dehydrogenase-like predicted oxidoreductase